MLPTKSKELRQHHQDTHLIFIAFRKDPHTKTITNNQRLTLKTPQSTMPSDATTGTDLPLTKVTLYKNNLAFFERQAKIHAGQPLEDNARLFRLEIPLDLKELVRVRVCNSIVATFFSLSLIFFLMFNAFVSVAFMLMRVRVPVRATKCAGCGYLVCECAHTRGYQLRHGTNRQR